MWQSRDFDPFLPVQYYKAIAGCAGISGERRLLLAILEDAMRSYVKAKGRSGAEKRIEFREVRDWFFNKNDQQTFSFEWICSIVEIDSSFLRRRLTQLTSDDIPRKHYYGCGRRIMGLQSRIVGITSAGLFDEERTSPFMK